MDAKDRRHSSAYVRLPRSSVRFHRRMQLFARETFRLDLGLFDHSVSVVTYYCRVDTNLEYSEISLNVENVKFCATSGENCNKKYFLFVV